MTYLDKPTPEEATRSTLQGKGGDGPWGDCVDRPREGKGEEKKGKEENVN